MAFSSICKYPAFLTTRIIVLHRNLSSLTAQNETQNLVNRDYYERKEILQNSSQDLSAVSPYFPKTFNLAAYVNNSELLQNLIHLNVNLAKLEKKPNLVEKILKLDFTRIKHHILFLNDYIGEDEIGNYITRNPMILHESLNDLEIRINYLQFKQFSKTQIERIVSKNPFWLMFSTTRIDRRLGHFQEKFNLFGDEVRFLAARQPQLITYNLHHVTVNTFVFKEEMGFQDSEIKEMILNKPKLLMISQKSLLERFRYLHNTMHIPHTSLQCHPEVLLCRNFKVKQRHLFLKKLGRDQYHPNKENYVPIKALVEGTDLDFCKLYAKCNISDFNIFLKTM